MSEKSNQNLYLAKFPVTGEYIYITSDKNFNPKDMVKCETPYGDDICQVTQKVENISEEEECKSAVLATTADLELKEKNKQKVKEFLPKIKKQISDKNISLKLVGVHLMTFQDKIVIFFTSDGRVDFRELVKDLNEELRPNRIQMRQITGREAARFVANGIGVCGRRLCCDSCGKVAHFPNVTRKMVKEQNIKQEEFKLLGPCDNIKCCYNYEAEFYRNEMAYYPAIRAQVQGKNGIEIVKDINIISQNVTLENKDRGHRVVSARLFEMINGDQNGPNWIIHEEEEE